MEHVKTTMRVKLYSLRFGKTYCYWIRFYIRFNNLYHRVTMTNHEVRQFSEYLAIERQVVAT
ncbi:phage integrase N-terminal SAM-like domain-containing protein [Halomonas meridiana]|uniref:phage integrase N-terminal SAM-like domain-containing protein n=1 Tax=Halomonadaceae TaxID=28256 RepID=UPI002556AA8B|nr:MULTISPECIES: phage integrase N-terminal SAM-like domain-containing protein [Halomonas]MDK9686218.1 phage integrase N-terminal SAM-like domain-containing protein [Halomonas sp. LC1]MDP4559287.1 phage integrase N-terminal SAM-like domain-containing protein [Halomonas meridiana]